ncbi:MAG: major capsid protein [Microviridae sp.]|nr:MAG: major capsid protein [Microviridae sp.]
MKMKNFMNSVRLKRPDSNMFALNHMVQTSGEMGTAFPLPPIEVLPGDRIKLNQVAKCRFMPLVAPGDFMADIKFYNVFVANRTIWPQTAGEKNGWEDWLTMTTTGGVLPAFPTITIDPGVNYTRLMNRLGIPDPGLVPGSAEQEVVSALPFAAYQKAWSDLFRNQQTMPDELDYLLQPGDNTANTELTVLRPILWEKDLYTSATIQPQKGDEVTIPVAGFNDVPIKMQQDPIVDAAFGWNGVDVPSSIPGTGSVPMDISDDPSLPDRALFADTSEMEAFGVPISEWRFSLALQKLKERLNVAGSRYFEWIKAFTGITSPDARLQRAELFSSNSTPISFSEVLNTTGETGGLPQGNMAGHGLGIAVGKDGYYNVKEHGFIITFMCVRPRTVYSQGIRKLWLKTTDPTQYFNHLFAHVGDEAILKKELYAYTDHEVPEFGYSRRYYDYCTIPSYITGEAANSLDFWNLGRQFDAPPALNQSFVICNPRTDIFAVTAPIDNLIITVRVNLLANRQIPVYGTPNV